MQSVYITLSVYLVFMALNSLHGSWLIRQRPNNLYHHVYLLAVNN